MTRLGLTIPPIGTANEDAAPEINSILETLEAAFEYTFKVGELPSDPTVDAGPQIRAKLAEVNALAVPGPNGENSVGARVRVPFGVYRINGNLDFIRQIDFAGEDGFGDHPGTFLKLDDGSSLVIHRYNTHGAGDTGAGDWTKIRKIGLLGAATTTGTAHAIIAYARFKLEEFTIQDFGGDAVHIAGGGAMGPAGQNTNANNYVIRDGRITGCLNGIWAQGSDSNNGQTYSVDIVNCRSWAVFDESFLGSSYWGLHARGNLAGPYYIGSNNATGGLFSCYSEGGQGNGSRILSAAYRVEGGIHGAGFTQDTIAAIALPGTNGLLWGSAGDGGGGAGVGSMLSQCRRVTDASIGAANNRMTSPTAAFTAADVGATVRLQGAGAFGTPLITTVTGYVSATQVDLALNATTAVAGAAMTITTKTGFAKVGLAGTQPVAFYMQLAGEGNFRLKWDLTNGGGWYWFYGNAQAALGLTTDSAVDGSGRSIGTGYPHFPRGVVHGTGGLVRRHDVGSDAGNGSPAATDVSPTLHRKGDIRWNRSPAAGGRMGWVCIADGTPAVPGPWAAGTWKAFGAIDA